jgi:3-methyladenine DNA glycosylase/8-oxoguanine DNA glycosylase
VAPLDARNQAVVDRFVQIKLKPATEPAAIEALSSRWRPWRSYSVQHLWALADAAA